MLGINFPKQCVDWIMYYDFPKQCVDWIMYYVKTVNYTILINSCPTEPFHAKKSVQQRDSLSHYLFVLGMEYLTKLLKNLSTNPYFNYHPRYQKIKIIQLSFADDLLLFCRGDLISGRLLFDCFQ